MKASKPRSYKPQVDELSQQLKKLDNKQEREMRDRRVTRLNDRKQFLDAQLRTNLRNEYDRLVGEIPSVVRLANGESPIIAGRVSSALYRRIIDLKGLNRQSLQPTKHEIEK